MNVVLIGYRGCGKTTVGRLLAERYDVGFVDTDELIVHQTGKSIAEIFATDGETAFRKLEEAAIKLATKAKNRIISVGGGAVESNANRKALRKFGTIVWLQADAESIWHRISNDKLSRDQRPNLTVGGIEEVRSVLEKRSPIYAELSQIAVATSGRPAKDVAEDVSAWLEVL